MKKICVVTGTRAEYSLLKNTIFELKKENNIDLKVVATGAHMSSEFGSTYREIEQDGIEIYSKIPMLPDEDTNLSVLESMSDGLKDFANFFNKEKFDLVILLGDRTEIFIVATAAMIMRVPIAHIHGGELSLGAIDNALRYSISYMSNIHFVATEASKKRLMQVGIDENQIYFVGAPGVENVLKTEIISKEELSDKIDFNLNDKYAVILFHPETLAEISEEEQITELLSGIEKSVNDKNMKYIIISSNADKGGRKINTLFKEFADKYNNIVFKSNLENQDYLSLVSNAEFLIGNSSSGIIEAPSLKIISITLGDRQKGRESASSIIHLNIDKNEISEIIDAILNDDDFKNNINFKNPYEKADTSKKIKEVILRELEKGVQIQKKFIDRKIIGKYNEEE